MYKKLKKKKTAFKNLQFAIYNDNIRCWWSIWRQIFVEVLKKAETTMCHLLQVQLQYFFHYLFSVKVSFVIFWKNSSANSNF